MKRKKTSHVVKAPLYVVLVVFLAVASMHAALGLKVLHNFTGADGGSPNALIQDSDGFLYGSAGNGGDDKTCAPDGCGLLFKIDTAGHYTILHKFKASDGILPTGLVKGKDGHFYGTTMSGGQPSGGGAGTFFRMEANGDITTLYAFVGGFACCDGGGPTAQPIQASDGNFYGTTGAGGAFRDIDHQGGFGTVYQFNPVTGVMSIIHSFNLADGNGIFPNGPLVQASDGFFYGTTREGGATGGTLFRVDSSGNLTLIANLTGTEPLSGVIQASDGLLYGTDDGSGSGGSLYRSDTSGNVTFMNRFDGADGFGPHYRMMQATDGFLYGTTPQGGLLNFQGGDVFRFSTRGALRVLHSFVTSGPEGFIPNAELIQGVDGALYGTNGIGGSGGHGTVFRIDPRAQGPVASITVNPAVIHSGQSSTGTVTLFSPAPTGGKVITLGAQLGPLVIPATVTVPAGAKTATFTIKSNKIGATVKVRIYASVAGQGTRTTITVQP